MKKAKLRLHPKRRRLEDDCAVLTYTQVADEFFKRTGVRISKARVWQHLCSAHRKIRAALQEEITS